MIAALCERGIIDNPSLYRADPLLRQAQVRREGTLDDTGLGNDDAGSKQNQNRVDSGRRKKDAAGGESKDQQEA